MGEGNLYVSVDYGRATGPAVDDGTRPWTREDPPFWANASIWLEPGIDKAKVGQPSFIHVRVSNKSRQEMKNVQVQTFIFTPTVGVPVTFNDCIKNNGAKLGIPSGSGTNAADDGNVVKIGPWTPGPGDLKGDGHMCLIANVFQTEEGAFPLPPDPGSHEIVSQDENPFNPNGDPHQCQRNIQLLPATQQAIQQPVKVVYTTRPSSPTVHPRAYQIKMDLVDIDGFTADELFILSRQREIEFTGSESKDGELRLKTSWGTERIARGPRPLSFDLKAEGIPGLGQTFERDARMPQEIPSELEVQIDPEAPVGSLHTFDITLHDEKELVGSGLRVMVLVTE
ncbi:MULTISPECIES: hypothetical protein [unclassified Streptomyces]|uniref:hypothetical protein n=1 Tax=Streptomyces sp. NPDC127532 TaxID=3345399 RepID=UPI0036346DE4